MGSATSADLWQPVGREAVSEFGLHVAYGAVTEIVRRLLNRR